MTQTQTQTFTREDVAALAELIRPHVAAGLSVSDAVAQAAADSDRQVELARHGVGPMFTALTTSLRGTYDAFRAEAGLADGEYAYQRARS